MDFSRHKHKFPVEISEYFHSSWDNREHWRLEAPRMQVAISELAWLLDYPFLSSSPPLPLFDLLPRAVLSSPHEFSLHWNRVQAADLSFPINVTTFGGRLVILDGVHRLLKSIHDGSAMMECKFIARKHIRTAVAPSVSPLVGTALTSDE